MMRSSAQQLIPITDCDCIVAVSSQGVELATVGGEVGAEAFEALGCFGRFFGVGLLVGEGGVAVEGAG